MSAADRAFARALEHWQAASLQEAHAACLEAIGHDAGHAAAAALAAEVMLRVGAPRPAAALLEDVVARAAQRDSTSARAGPRDDGAARVLLARAQRTAGDARAAERSSAAARLLDPGSPEAAAEHALALIALGRLAEAAIALGEAAAAAGDDAHAHWVVADTRLRLRPRGEADGPDGAEHLGHARAAFARAVALDPAAATWHATEAAHEMAAGRRDEARGLVVRGLALLPQDPQLAHMAAAGEGRSPDRASGAYVAAHFDAFADSFDEVLVGRLGYRLPELIGAALERRIGGAGTQVDVLDAGCGTGLCAARLRPLARRLVGVDLSARMVAQARALGLYDELVVADLLAWLGEDAQAGAFDVIVAADVLVYFGDLGPPLAAAARALRPGGLVVFSTERAQHGGVALEPSGRFSHDPRYVQARAAECGLDQLGSDAVSYRIEGGEPVGSSLICVRLAAPRTGSGSATR